MIYLKICFCNLKDVRWLSVVELRIAAELFSHCIHTNGWRYRSRSIFWKQKGNWRLTSNDGVGINDYALSATRKGEQVMTAFKTFESLLSIRDFYCRWFLGWSSRLSYIMHRDVISSTRLSVQEFLIWLIIIFNKWSFMKNSFPIHLC